LQADTGHPFDSVRPVRWTDGALELLDQRRLPGVEEYLKLESCGAVENAIRDMVVRGAPAIGIAAAYGTVLAAREAFAAAGDGWRGTIAPLIEALAHARPTAVNLHWAIARMQSAFPGITGDPEPELLVQARCIHGDDIAGNRRMGDLGAGFVDGTVLTYCNAGSLATGGYGTALGVVRSAWRDRRIDRVYACETRPWLQGARLTAWELQRDGIPVTLIADAAAASLMAAGAIRHVIVGADRIAANGDVANKIGTYGIAVLARYHGIPFMVAAPVSTLDPETAAGSDIPIERRHGDEIVRCAGVEIAPRGTPADNPVFDVTPAALVTRIVTEKGVVERPDRARISALLAAG
jgi:methylthioribose-1-phosphate isomerase